MLPEERAAEQTIDGLAQQLLDLDYENPLSFGMAQAIGQEIANAALFAQQARAGIHPPVANQRQNHPQEVA